ncbi:MAG: hypothetical protein AB7V42_17300 [Thermoleophilia bacterium]
MLTDYHTHLRPDGATNGHGPWEADGGHLSPAWIGRYVARGRARAVSEIAITEHARRFSETRGWRDEDWWRDGATEDLEAYCAAVASARAQGLPVLLGLEVGWLPERRGEIAALVAGRPFDLVLACPGPGARPGPGAPADEVWSVHLDALAAAARSGLFDVVWPPDRPAARGVALPASLAPRLDETIDALAAAGAAVECSSKGLRGARHELSPAPAVLARLREAGVPVVLSSAAHRPQDVARDYATTVAALRGAGYETITRLSRRSPSQVPIRWA